MRLDHARTVIDVWLPSYPAVPDYLGGIRALAASFHEAHPDYEVRVRESSYKTLPADVDAAARRGEAPALVQYFHTSTQLARDMRGPGGAPLIRPLETALDGRTRVLGEPVVTGDVIAPARGYYSAGGTLLAAPPLVSTTLLYANTDLLAAAGVTELPTTWAELTAAGKAVLAHTGRAAITWPNHGWIFQQAVAQQGGLLADHANGREGRAERVDLAAPELVAFAEWWRGLHQDGIYHYIGGQAYGDNTGRAWEENFVAFAEQRVAFVLSSSVEAEWLIQAGRDRGFGVAVGRMPHNGEVRYAGNIVGGDAIWLTDSPDPAVQDGALAFLQHLLAPHAAAERHKATWFIPVTTTAIDLLHGEGWFDERPHQRVAIDQLLATDGSPAARGALLGEFPRIQGVMTQAMEDVLVRGVEPLRSFTNASADAQRLLDEYNADCLGERPGPPGPRRFVVD
ncbi:extracellular solute-binding protein [Phytohabitans sp. LJ34]|uniref:extracellular solute-binding protein n=1 Tax=Phytohabitans sp. LJ34 TaxID=3452217 RepID=UPI003F88A96B